MPPPRRAQQLGRRVVDAVRAAVRGPAPVVEAGSALGVVARQPFVADASADAEARAQLGDRKAAGTMRVDEA
jgi:hypothetical protein